MPAPLIGLGLLLPVLTVSTLKSDGVDFDYLPLEPLQARHVGGPPSLALSIKAGASEPFLRLSYDRSASTMAEDEYRLRRFGATLGYRAGFPVTDGVQVGPEAWAGYTTAKGLSTVHTLSTVAEVEGTGREAQAGLGGFVGYLPAPWLHVGARGGLSVAYGQAEGEFRPAVDPLAWVEMNEPFAWTRTGWEVGLEATWLLPVDDTARSE